MRLDCLPEKQSAVRFMPGLLWSMGLFAELLHANTEVWVSTAAVRANPLFTEQEREELGIFTKDHMEEFFTAAVDPIFGKTSGDWTIRYTSLAEAVAADRAARKKLARIFGVVTSTSGAPHQAKPAMDETGFKFGEAEIQTEDGRYLTLRLLPGAKLTASSGEKIAVFGRLVSTSTPTLQVFAAATMY